MNIPTIFRSAPVAIALVVSIGSNAGAQTVNLDAAPRLRLVETQRIGSSTDPNQGFTNITSVALDRDGNLYAYDRAAFAVKVFSSSGRFVRTIGREGQGPGEFDAWPATIGVKGDSLWVTTRGERPCALDVVMFRRDGRYLSTTPLRRIEVRLGIDNMGVPAPIHMFDDGRMQSGELECLTNPQSRANGGGGGGAGRGGAPSPPATAATVPVSRSPVDVKVPRVMFNLATGAADTVGWFVRNAVPPLASSLVRIMIEGRSQVIPRPPSDPRLAAALRDGRVSIDRTAATRAGPATIGIVRTSLSGDTISRITLRYEPVRYTNAVLDSIALQSARNVRIVNGAYQDTPYANRPAALAAIRAEMRFPVFQMPVTQVLALTDGTIWLRREDRGEATLLWHVLESTGQVRGTVALGRRASPVWMSGATLWAIDFDDDDVPWVVRYRMER